MSKEDKIIDRITKKVGLNFRSFGGGRATFNNPVAHALQDKPFSFAAGVDIKSVVKFVLKAQAEAEKV